jgi:DNA-binding NtrC family response regulator
MARILVVDDDPMVLALVRESLETSEDEEHEILLALNGDRALEMFRAQPCDLVITDVFMPGKDGLEIMRAVQMIHPEVKCIVMSGESVHMGAFALRTAAREGADYTLEKPFSPTMLLEAVDRVLAQAREL